MATKFTKANVEALSPRAATFIEWDTETRGLGLLITKAGVRSWVVQYRSEGGRRGRSRRMTIGRAGSENMTPTEARVEAKKILGQVSGGGDPAARRSAARQAARLSEVAAKFTAPTAVADRASSTTALYGIYFNKHILPALGSRAADSITRADVKRLHRAIGATKQVTANRAIKVLQGMYTWAIGAEEIERKDNPAKGIDPYREEGCERYLSSEELGRLGDTLRIAETIGLPYEVDETKPGAKHFRKPENRLTVIDPFAIAAIRLLVLTGARLREILHLRWTEIDFERGYAMLPTSKTKRKPLILNAAALTVLAGLHRVGEYCIAGASAGAKDERPRADLQRPWDAIKRHARLEGVRIHDLRHTNASVGAGAGLGLQIIGRLLGHKRAETTQRYAHLADDPLKRAADRVGTDIAAAMGDGAAPAGEVVEMGGRRR